MSRIAAYSMVTAVIFVITLIFSILFAGEIKEIYFGVVDKSTCKSSVAVHSASCLQGLPAQDIKCPTINMQIKDNNEEITKGKLAKSLYDCWDQFGRGENEICGGEGIYCSICSYITFENKNLKIEDFSGYLSNHNAPGSNIKYADFLSGGKAISEEFQSEKEKKTIKDTLDTSVQDTYAIIYVQIKDKDQIKNYLEITKSELPGVGVMAVGFGIFKVGSAITGLSWWTGGGLIAGVSTQITGGVIMLGGALYSYIAGYLNGVSFDKVSYVYFGPYNAQAFRDLGCTDLPASQS
jgi:hypothetical protein